MNTKDIQVLFEFDRWANQQTIAAARAITPEQLERNLGNSFPSVRETLVHIIAAEWIWLERWRGSSPGTMLDPARFPTLDSIRVELDSIEAGQIELIDGLNDVTLEKAISYVNRQGVTLEYKLAQMMQHLVNHSTYHRGQVTTMLRQLGAEAVPTDFLDFVDATSSAKSQAK